MAGVNGNPVWQAFDSASPVRGHARFKASVPASIPFPLAAQGGLAAPLHAWVAVVQLLGIKRVLRCVGRRG